MASVPPQLRPPRLPALSGFKAPALSVPCPGPGCFTQSLPPASAPPPAPPDPEAAAAAGQSRRTRGHAPAPASGPPGAATPRPLDLSSDRTEACGRRQGPAPPLTAFPSPPARGWTRGLSNFLLLLLPGWGAGVGWELRQGHDRDWDAPGSRFLGVLALVSEAGG